MAFFVSPAVDWVEKDFTGIVKGVPSSFGAVVGVFNWGAVNKPIQVSNESELVATYGKPDNDTAPWFFAATSFLSYSSNLWVNRIKTTAMNTANALAAASFLIENEDDFELMSSTDRDAGGTFSARYPGSLGNSLAVSFADYKGFQNTLTGTIATTASSATITGTSTLFTTELTVGDNLEFTANSVDYSVEITAIASDTSLTIATALPSGGANTVAGLTAVSKWKYFSDFSYRPDATGTQELLNASGKDEIHLVVVDKNGAFTGTAGTILEKYTGLSKGTGAKTSTGENNYYADVLNRFSRYVYVTDIFNDTNISADLLSATGSDPGAALSTTAFKTMNRSATVTLSAGDADSDAPTNAGFLEGLDLFSDDEQYDISLLFLGKANTVVANYAVTNVAHLRRDLMVFASPQDVSDASVIQGNTSTEIDKLIAYADALTTSSYLVVDNGYKQMYDRYNDLNRWVPLNGDLAGLCAYTDFVADPWFSPAGQNRGGIKNCIKLAVNPNKTQQGTLYQANVNFVISKKGQGHILFGDKTHLIRPSAFDRINVRRMFMVVEKSIATAAQFMLFENNTDLTRRQFVAMVEPFLRDVQGRSGIEDFRIIADDTVNTPQVIANNEFRANIMIRPVYSINFILLTFSAVGGNISFDEVAGA